MINYIANMFKDYCVVSNISIQWMQTYWVGLTIIAILVLAIASYIIWNKTEV